MECQLRAVEALLAVKAGEGLVLDSAGEILAEYRKHGDFSGQPGVGDEFYRWAVETRLSLQSVALTADGRRRYVEFPADHELQLFDWDDRVFVATAIVSETPLTNVSDSDYSHNRIALERNGLFVEELCPGELKPAS